MKTTQLLIIDAQNDFCDLPTDNSYKPALPIPGAHQDCLRLAQLIAAKGACFSSITATLDSHHRIDLAHYCNWLDADEQEVAPFSQITANDVIAGRFRLKQPLHSKAVKDYLITYLQTLEALQRTLTLWPIHCEIGTIGHNLHPAISQALRQWETRTAKTIAFVHKGENIWTESYSALKAVLPYPGDSGTELNQALLAQLLSCDELLIAGQASSHCVKETVLDLLHYGGLNAAKKLVLLTDCMSAVLGYENQVQQFYSDLNQHGVRLTTSAMLTESY